MMWYGKFHIPASSIATRPRGPSVKKVQLDLPDTTTSVEALGILFLSSWPSSRPRDILFTIDAWQSGVEAYDELFHAFEPEELIRVNELAASFHEKDRAGYFGGCGTSQSMRDTMYALAKSSASLAEAIDTLLESDDTCFVMRRGKEFWDKEAVAMGWDSIRAMEVDTSNYAEEIYRMWTIDEEQSEIGPKVSSLQSLPFHEIGVYTLVDNDLNISGVYDAYVHGDIAYIPKDGRDSDIFF